MFSKIIFKEQWLRKVLFSFSNTDSTAPRCAVKELLGALLDKHHIRQSEPGLGGFSSGISFNVQKWALLFSLYIYMHETWLSYVPSAIRIVLGLFLDLMVHVDYRPGGCTALNLLI